MNYFFYEDDKIRIEHKLDQSMSQDQCFLHTHLNAELYFFLNGITKIHIDDSVYEAAVGDVFLIRPNEPHYFEVTPDEPYERIVVNFDPHLFKDFDKKNYISNCFYNRHFGEKNQYHSTDFFDKNYSSYFMSMVNKENSNEVNIYACLFMILKAAADVFNSDVVMESPITNTVESEIIRYVNDYLEKPLSVDAVCQHFFVSRSKLTHIFKHNTGMAPWEYITVKRLNKAQNLIINGYLPTKVYSLCGFDNYTSFYRAYTKYYGNFPSHFKVSKLNKSKE
ncbi:MAG: helix-turn-helix transcriptional regulator [Clostridia bacterium]|nr:helix-turn-helix transcriptional regulator [Clostridia bacterium]